MNSVTLELRDYPIHRIDMSGLTPDKITGMTPKRIVNLKLYLGNRQIRVGELFSIKGKDCSTLVIRNACERLDRIGADLTQGQIIIEGNAGAYLGQNMSGGMIRVMGNTEAFAGATMKAGQIRIEGNTKDFLGSATAGERKGMQGGIIRVDGNAGDRVGDRQRRGLIMIRGDIGDYCAARMLAGTIVTLGQTGRCVGYGMRRGTLLLAKYPVSFPGTFNDNGYHIMNFLPLMMRHITQLDREFNKLKATGNRVHRFLGDLAWQGKGEIMIWD